MSEIFPRVAFPGDKISLAEYLDDPSAPEIKLGPGLRLVDAETDHPHALVVVAGVLQHREPARYWVDVSCLHASQGETVIGIIKSTAGEGYQVDIGSATPARLNGLAFEAATKRNRPRLQIGDLVYARLSLCNKDMEPELTCVNASGKANGLGPLTDGFMVECSLSLSRKLLKPGCAALDALGRYAKFELAVGSNGRLWVKADTAAHTIIVVNALVASENLPEKQFRKQMKRLFSS